LKRKAVILLHRKKNNICCDISFLPEFEEYFISNVKNYNEMRVIFNQIREGQKSPKYGSEPYGTSTTKPFKNNDNDRIICSIYSRKGKTKCIIMSELHLKKKSNKVDKSLSTRYKIISKYEYEIIE
jgi:hypothetical protein